jgi:allantoicase
MKTMFLPILIILFSLPGYAQVYKFKTIETCYQPVGKPENKTDWSKADILVVVNYDDDKIRIYSEEQQDFDIVKYYKKETDENGDKWFRYQVVDHKGKNCHIRLLIFKDTEQIHVASLMLEYSDYIFVYRLKSN